jgi:16S rRNA (cytosine967-C5)-methyltransferase
MNPAARTQAVLDLLEKIEKSSIPMDSTIGDYMRFRKYIGSKDRAFIAETVYKIMRHRARIFWALDRLNFDHTARAQMIFYWTILDPHPRPIDLFDGSKYGPDELTEQELDLYQKLKNQILMPEDMPHAVRTETPPLYQDSLELYFGKDFEKEMSAMIDGAPLDLRINVHMAPLEKVEEYLKADGVETERLPFSPWGLRVKGKTFLSRTKAFVKGWVDIQDEGSQLIAVACDVKPGMQVLDYCAGAGGKTLALANAMKVKGRIVAMDLEANRLEKGRERFRRAHVTDIIEIRPLSDERHRKWLKRQDESFDVVLTDVPCTGTGTWRRNPDMRWRTYGPDLNELVQIQADIMDRVVHVVKPGGRLVYATCSILPEENEEQIEKFLSRHSDFVLRPLSEIWPAGLSCPTAGPTLRLTPYRHNTDGFFAAILEKKIHAA